MENLILKANERKNTPPYKNYLNQGNVKPPVDVFAVPARLQARLDARQVAKILNFSERDIPVLVQCGLLKPLGNPNTNAIKYFAATEIQELGQNATWLYEATEVIYDHGRKKESRKTINANERESLVPAFGG
jgi:hypothetical protein